jgi:hypothetical protein
MTSRLERGGRSLELAHRELVQRGDGLIQMLVDGVASA